MAPIAEPNLDDYERVVGKPFFGAPRHYYGELSFMLVLVAGAAVAMAVVGGVRLSERRPLEYEATGEGVASDTVRTTRSRRHHRRHHHRRTRRR
jgi:hypothetical protein